MIKLILSIITPVFSVTWSFRNHSDMLFWCSRNIVLLQLWKPWYDMSLNINYIKFLYKKLFCIVTITLLKDAYGILTDGFCCYSSNEMWWSGTTRRTSPNLCLWKKTQRFRNTAAGSVSSTVRTAHDCATSTTLWTSERQLCFNPNGLLKGRYQYFFNRSWYFVGI